MRITADEEGKRLLSKIMDAAGKHDILGGEAMAPFTNRVKQCLVEADQGKKSSVPPKPPKGGKGKEGKDKKD